MKLLGIVFCFLCVNYLEASTTYTVGVFSNTKMKKEDYASMVDEAAKMDVDILVLPSMNTPTAVENYDKIVKSLSSAAKIGKVYVVANLYEQFRCRDDVEVTRNNLVFNRKGSIVSVYKKPVSSFANCTKYPEDLVKFTTDFGVSFGLLMDEDIVIHNADYMKGLKNFVMTGASNGFFLNGDWSPFSSSWSYVNKVNLISSHGIYGGKRVLNIRSGELVTAELDKNGNVDDTVLPTMNSDEFQSEDLNQYIIKPLNLEGSSRGYRETVCFHTFCCEFYAKTRITGQHSDVSYGLAVFDGIQTLSNQHNIGVQSCMLVACVGLYKRTCALGPNNSTDVVFEKISITANFTTHTTQYPIIQSRSVLPSEKMKFSAKSYGISSQALLEIIDSQNLFKFGLFGRDYSRDFESFSSQRNNSELTYDIYDFIFNENVLEIFDYVWIRFRIVLVVVSIYVLEMM